MTVLKIILTAMGMLKMLAQWFRDRSIHDAGRKAERAGVEKAERKAEDAVENIRPVTRGNLVDRLRNTDAEF